MSAGRSTVLTTATPRAQRHPEQERQKRGDAKTRRRKGLYRGILPYPPAPSGLDVRSPIASARKRASGLLPVRQPPPAASGGPSPWCSRHHQFNVTSSPVAREACRGGKERLTCACSWKSLFPNRERPQAAVAGLDVGAVQAQAFASLRLCVNLRPSNDSLSETSPGEAQ